VNKKNDTDTSSSNGEKSIIDTYRVYFNHQSYQVSIIVLAFNGSLIAWMLFISILALIYRNFFEKHFDLEAYQAKQELKEVRLKKEEED
jgi:hypothetical protein